jgi:hypothetical protein
MPPLLTSRYSSPVEHRERPVWFIGLCLVALQLPFVLTRHIQEDAYITFRCAANLADLHVYGFNPGERVSASSSHVSVLAIALIRLITGDAFIPIAQILYGIATVVGLYFLATAVVQDRQQQIWVWILASVIPVSLTIAYGGMETGLLILLTGVIVRDVTLNRPNWWTYAAFVLLPWVRADAIAVGVLAIAAASLCRNISLPTASRYVALMLCGLLSWSIFNWLYFGTFLTQTIIGKAAVWSPSDMTDVIRIGASKLKAMFLATPGETALFLPIQTKYVQWLAIPALVASAAATVWVASRPSRFGARRVAVTALLLIALVPPIAYAASGVVYPWYLWPSQLAIGLLLIVFAIGWIVRQQQPWRSVSAYAGIAVVALLAIGQLVFAVSWGTQERLYRGGIGERIREISQPGDTLLLEPAGYVPFYAKLFTWDEIGLASPTVTAYRKRFGTRWWPRFVEDLSPTFLLERRRMPDGPTTDGYMLSAEEGTWFDRHYLPVEVFRYDPHALRSARILAGIAGLGTASDYFLYKRID